MDDTELIDSTEKLFEELYKKEEKKVQELLRELNDEIQVSDKSDR